MCCVCVLVASDWLNCSRLLLPLGDRLLREFSSQQLDCSDDQCQNAMITEGSAKDRQNAWLVSEGTEAAEEDLLQTTPRCIKCPFGEV